MVPYDNKVKSMAAAAAVGDVASTSRSLVCAVVAKIDEMTRGVDFPPKLPLEESLTSSPPGFSVDSTFHADVATEWRESYLNGGTVIKFTYGLRRG